MPEGYPTNACQMRYCDCLRAPMSMHASVRPLMCPGVTSSMLNVVFLDTMNFLNVQLPMVIAVIELYLFVPLGATLALSVSSRREAWDL